MRLQDTAALPWRLVVAYGLCALGALYTFYFVVFPLAALYGYAVWTWRGRGQALLRWTAVHVAVAILYVPWLPMMARQLGRVSGIVSTLPGFFMGPVYLGGIVRATAGILGADDAFFLEQSLTTMLPRPVLFAAAVLVLAVAGLLLVIGWRGLAARGGRPFAVLVLALVAGPLVLAVAAHLASGIVLLSRYFYVSFVFAIFLVASALGQLPSRRWQTALLVALSLVCLGRDVQLYAWSEVDWKGAASYVARHRQPGDRIVYVSDARAHYYMPREMDKVDVNGLLVSRVGALRIDDAVAARVAGGRTWLAISDTYLLRAQNDAIVKWLDGHGVRAGAARDFGSLRLTLYADGRREATR